MRKNTKYRLLKKIEKPQKKMADYTSDTNSTQASHLEEFSILIVSSDDHLFCTIAISSSEIKSKFVFFGKNADITVFDLYLDYSMDDKIHPRILLISLCKTFSVPLSYVMLLFLWNFKYRSFHFYHIFHLSYKNISCFPIYSMHALPPRAVYLFQFPCIYRLWFLDALRLLLTQKFAFLYLRPAHGINSIRRWFIKL